MGAKSEQLAKQFEAKSRDALATLGQLGEADWQKVTEAEKWPVGVTAHHLASVLEPISSMIKAVAAGQTPGDVRMERVEQMNARAARDVASWTPAGATAQRRRRTAAAAPPIRR